MQYFLFVYVIILVEQLQLLVASLCNLIGDTEVESFNKQTDNIWPMNYKFLHTSTVLKMYSSEVQNVREIPQGHHRESKN